MHDISQNPYIYLANALNTSIANLVVSRDNTSQNASPALLIDTDNVNVGEFVCVYKTTVDVGDVLNVLSNHKKIKVAGNVSAIDSDSVKVETKAVKLILNGEYIDINIDTSDIGTCEGEATKSVINVTGCTIGSGLLNDNTNIVNYGRGELT
jgi:hypothetical protein